MSIVCTEFRAFEKNTLRGFCVLVLEPSGLILKEVSLHEKNGARWVSFPGKPWTGKDGKTQYTNTIEFSTKEQGNLFRDAALRAIDTFRQGEARK